jgi:hypothetical protein
LRKLFQLGKEILDAYSEGNELFLLLQSISVVISFEILRRALVMPSPIVMIISNDKTKFLFLATRLVMSPVKVVKDA